MCQPIESRCRILGKVLRPAFCYLPLNNNFKLKIHTLMETTVTRAVTTYYQLSTKQTEYYSMNISHLKLFTFSVYKDIDDLDC